jgi:hypothetical protein
VVLCQEVTYPNKWLLTPNKWLLTPNKWLLTPNKWLLPSQTPHKPWRSRVPKILKILKVLKNKQKEIVNSVDNSLYFFVFLFSIF